MVQFVLRLDLLRTHIPKRFAVPCRTLSRQRTRHLCLLLLTVICHFMIFVHLRCLNSIRILYVTLYSSFSSHFSYRLIQCIQTVSNVRKLSLRFTTVHSVRCDTILFRSRVFKYFLNLPQKMFQTRFYYVCCNKNFMFNNFATAYVSKRFVENKNLDSTEYKK